MIKDTDELPDGRDEGVRLPRALCVPLFHHLHLFTDLEALRVPTVGIL